MTNTNQQNTEQIYYQTIINNIESMIKKGEFKSKEDLNNYLQNLKNHGIPESYLPNEKILYYLNLYDQYNKAEYNGIDIANYKGVSLENQNMIVSTNTDEVLKTDQTPEHLDDEFKQAQNEITANSKDSLANANEVFTYLKDNKKEEMTFIPIEEALNRNNLNKEILFKIKFFISNQHINPYLYSVNLENGIFYNKETQELFEIRKNEQTGTYEIYKGGEIAYADPTIESTAETNSDEFEKTLDTPEEQMSYENKNIKVRRLIKPSTTNNAAFAKSTFLILILTILTVLLGTFIILSR